MASSSSARAGVSFLLFQGRVLADAFVHMLDTQHVLLDCDTEAMPLLMDHLRRFKVRSKVVVVHGATRA